MATLTWRPTSASGTSWQNTSRVYDGNNSQAATVSINSSNYSNRYLTVNFSTVDLPEYAQISSATLYIIAKQSSSTSSRRITVQVDINGDSSSRVINTQLTSTSNTTLNGDVSSYINNLTSLKITGQTTGSSYQSQTFSIYEVYVDIEYEIVEPEPEPEPDIPGEGTSETTIDIFLPQPLGSNDKLYWDDIANRYFIKHSTGLIQTDIINKIEFNTCNPYMKITTDEKEVAPTNITVELAKKEDVGGDTPEQPSEDGWTIINIENGRYAEGGERTTPESNELHYYFLSTDLIDVSDGKDIYMKVQRKDGENLAFYYGYIYMFSSSDMSRSKNDDLFWVEATNDATLIFSQSYSEDAKYVAAEFVGTSPDGNQAVLSPNDIIVTYRRYSND